MLYNINDKPKPLAMVLYGLQWWAVSMPSVIIMGLVVSRLHYGPDLAAKILYMQKLFVIVGLTTAGQILFGHRLPVVNGPAAVFLIGVIASAASGIDVVYTAIFVSGLMVSVLAVTGVLGRLLALFTRRVVVTIMILIPFTLLPTITTLVFQAETPGLFDMAFPACFVFGLVVVNRMLPGVWRAGTVLLGIAVGTLVVYLARGFPVMPVVPPGNGGGVQIIGFSWDSGVVVSFLVCGLVLIVNEVGSVQAVGGMLQTDDLPVRSRRAVLMTGLSTMVSGLFGVMGTVDYTTSPGIIAASRCASRWAFIPAAVLLVACGVSAGAVSAMLLLPGLVMGSVLLYVMTAQLAAAFVMIIRDQVIRDFDECMTVAVPVMLAMIAIFVPDHVLASVPALVRPICGNGLVVGVGTVLVFEHVVYRRSGPAKS